MRITHLVPGKPARVTYTAAMMEKEGKLTAAANLRVHNHTKTAMQVGIILLRFQFPAMILVLRLP